MRLRKNNIIFMNILNYQKLIFEYVFNIHSTYDFPTENMNME